MYFNLRRLYEHVALFIYQRVSVRVSEIFSAGLYVIALIAIMHHSLEQPVLYVAMS